MLLVALFGEPFDAASTERLSALFAPNLRCPEPATLLDALELRLAPLHVGTDASAPARYRLDVARAGARTISLELREGEALLATRTLEVAPGDCAVVADTLALITATWIHAPRPAEAQSALPPPSAALDTGEPARVDAPDTLQPNTERAQVRESAAERKPERPSAVPRDSSQPSAAERETPDVARPGIHLALEVAGGTALPFGEGPAPVAIARIGVEASRGRWLLGLRGLYELEELSGEQIAEIVRCPVKTVWTRLFHARRELATLAQTQGERSSR